jgi:hypothetical protein
LGAFVKRGAAVSAGKQLATVFDARIDKSRLQDLERRLKEGDARLERVVSLRDAMNRALDKRLAELKKRRVLIEAETESELRYVSSQLGVSDVEIAAARKLNAIDQRLKSKGLLPQIVAYEDERRLLAARYQSEGLSAKLPPLKTLLSDPEARLLNQDPELNARVDGLALGLSAVTFEVSELKANQRALADDLHLESARVAKFEMSGLNAPAAGTILKVDRNTGEFTQPGEAVVHLVGGSRHVESLFPGRFAALIRPGARASILLPGRAIVTGAVKAVAANRPDAESQAALLQLPGGEDLIRVSVQLDDAGTAGLEPGLPVAVFIEPEQASRISAILRRMWQFSL